MNKTEFLRRFSLTSPVTHPAGFRYSGKLKQAGVLIGLIEKSDGLHVLLTQRAAHLKHHGGQISFPGGRYEEADESLIYTALREAEEEIALSPNLVDIVGQLTPRQTISGYQVTPFIGLLPSELELNADSNEVAEIFQVPLSHFLNIKNHNQVMVQHGKNKHPVYFMPYQDYNIWGATAAMLKDLVEQIS
jgi:8-oxo-dGTP pyrophosphatase MutT (NUDIX family)